LVFYPRVSVQSGGEATCKQKQRTKTIPNRGRPKLFKTNVGREKRGGQGFRSNGGGRAVSRAVVGKRRGRDADGTKGGNAERKKRRAREMKEEPERFGVFYRLSGTQSSDTETEVGGTEASPQGTTKGRNDGKS